MSCESCVNADAPARCVAAGCEELIERFNKWQKVVAGVVVIFFAVVAAGAVMGAKYRRENPRGYALTVEADHGRLDVETRGDR